MKRTFLATMGVTAVLALAVGTANAEMVLKLDDGAGHSVTLFDTDDDGVISFNGMLGDWAVLAAVGTSKPFIPGARMDLFSVEASNSADGPASITISLTDTDFDLDLDQPWFLVHGIGGGTDGTVTSEAYADASNVEWGTDFGDTTGEMTADAFGNFGGGFVKHGFTPAGLFSMTNIVTIVHGEGFGLTSFNGTVEIIPEPGATALGMIGLGALILFRRR